MKDIQHILSHVRSAVEDYGMISKGDLVAVGVSGGKDSLTLLCALAELRRFLPASFDVVAITVDMGFDKTEPRENGAAPPFAPEPIRALCDSYGIRYIIEKTEIARVIFDMRKESNPCSLCARMRRGAIHDAAKAAGANKLALGHHFDDVAETMMLNLFFEGRLGCFQPVTYLSRKDLTLIRPLIYVPEKEIKYFSKRAGLPVVSSPCPADGNTEREHMKKLLDDFDRRHKGVRNRIVGALRRSGIDGWHD